MKRILLLIALGVAVTLNPAWASGPEVASEEWLAPAVSAAEPDVAPELGVPEVQYQGPCSVNLNCGDGNIISCNGTSTCYASHYGGYVECDGNRTYCPNFCQLFLYCSNCPRCSGTFCATCTSTSGNCQQGAGWIKCNGWKVTCNQLCQGHPGS